MIIDFHTHTFPESIAPKTLNHLGKNIAHILPFTDGTASGLLSSMKKAGVSYSVTLPVMTNARQVEKINHGLMENRESLIEKGLIAFGGMHPDYADYKAELMRLKDSGMKGIKLHPAYQNIDLNDIRMKRIISAATEQDLIVLIHAGIDIGIYDHNYSSVAHILEILKDVAPTKFVLAHMGNWGCWDEVEHDLAGAPVWLDTAFSIGKISRHPGTDAEPYMNSNLSDEAFIRLTRKHGMDKILFATDSPWADQSEYIKLVNSLDLTDKEKEMIFSENALKLLDI